MDNESINKILKAGWTEIDNDISMHEEIRAVDRKTGTPVVSVFVINVHNMEEASKIKGKQYKPAKYSAPLEGQFTREETVQTLMTAAIATIKGIILIDELDDEGEQ